MTIMKKMKKINKMTDRLKAMTSSRLSGKDWLQTFGSPNDKYTRGHDGKRVLKSEVAKKMKRKD
jgi:hypothetical protein